MTRRFDVVVIGGGVAGLVAALDCLRAGFRVLVLEAGPRVGGSVAPLEIAGVVVDAGAESFATRGGHVEAYLRELGLGDAIVRPEPGGSWLHLPDGRTLPSPKAGVLGIPSVPLANDVRRIIGWRGALRAYVDRLRPVLTIGREHNLADLVEKRMGRAVLDLLVAPVTAGVYSANPQDIDIDIAAPGLNGALTRLGSLSGAVSELRAAAPAGAAVLGIDGGMHRLVARLREEIDALGGVVETAVGVLAVAPVEVDSVLAHARTAATGDAATPTTTEWRVLAAHTRSDEDGGTVERRESIEARGVLVAVPELQALGLLDDVVTLPDETRRPPRDLAIELVTLVIDDDRLDAAPRGSGLLVAPGATDVAAKALTHATAKWAWLAGSLGSGRHVVRLSYGRAGEAHPLDSLDDASVAELARRDASVLLGVDLAAESVVETARVRWTNAVPLAATGQKTRIEAFQAAVSALDGLEATGTWLAGTGLASVIPAARASAQRIRQHVIRRGVDIPSQEYVDDDYSGTHDSPGIRDERGSGQ